MQFLFVLQLRIVGCRFRDFRILGLGCKAAGRQNYSSTYVTNIGRFLNEGVQKLRHFCDKNARKGTVRGPCAVFIETRKPNPIDMAP